MVKPRHTAIAIILCAAIINFSGCTSAKVSNSSVQSSSAISNATVAANVLSNATTTVTSKTVSKTAQAQGAQPTKATVATTGTLTVSYIDVGQGDSELIQQGDQDMLIDTGTSDSQPSLLNYLKLHIHGDLEYLVLTHAHADHIGGASEVLDNFKVDHLFMTKYPTTTKMFETLLDTIKAKKITPVQPALGSQFKLGQASDIVYGPVGANQEDLNTCSIVIKVTFGSTKFFFGGDEQDSNESGMLANGYDVSATVLKVGHHGSETSTSAAFLAAVKPLYAIISCGKGNDYGHPTQLALDRLKSANVKVFRTDLDGTVVATSNGKTVSFNKSPSANEFVGASKGTAPKAAASSKAKAKAAPATPAAQAAAPATQNQSQIVYWTPNGKSYHSTPNCPTLKRSKVIESGTIQEAINSGHGDPCNDCVK